ncbi:MAG: VOC family protein [Myxococcota bacterium]
MVKNPPDGMPRLIPFLFYDDLAAALDWLAKAFGFEPRMSMPGPDGKIMHAEMQLRDAVIMMGPASDERQARSPSRLPAVNQSLYIYVDDVDAHFQQAKAAGARIMSEPEDMFWGDRMYYAQDSEGHHWNFAQHVKQVAPEDMKPPGA